MEKTKAKRGTSTYYNELIKNTHVNLGKPTPMSIVGCKIPARVLSIVDTIDYFCRIVDTNFEVIKSKSRKREVLRLRQILMHFMAKRLDKFEYVHYNSSLAEIGSYFGKAHCSVLHSRNAIDNDIATNKQFAVYYREIESRLMFMLNIAK